MENSRDSGLPCLTRLERIGELASMASSSSSGAPGALACAAAAHVPADVPAVSKRGAVDFGGASRCCEAPYWLNATRRHSCSTRPH